MHIECNLVAAVKSHHVLCYSVVILEMDTGISESHGSVSVGILDRLSRDFGSIPGYTQQVFRVLSLSVCLSYIRKLIFFCPFIILL